MPSHQFGIVLFLPLSHGQIEKGSAVDAGWITPPAHFDPRDPFCFLCGMKYINANDKPCPGITEEHQSRLYV